jgi:hypothetical protein
MLDDGRWMRVEVDASEGEDGGGKKVKEEREGREQREQKREENRRGSECPSHGASQSGSPNIPDIFFFLSTLLFPPHFQTLLT